MIRHYFTGALVSLLLIPTVGCSHKQPSVETPQQSFVEWKNKFYEKALAAGITEETFNRVLGSVQQNPDIVKLDRKQPEVIQPLAVYRENVLKRIEEPAKANYQKHKKLLMKVERQYHVPAHVMVSLWGTESNFGKNMGDIAVAQSLATLSHEGRRAALFESELLALLALHQSGRMPKENPVGSWAGAMGQCQFMPTAYRDKAVDADGDGTADIWASLPDIFASIGNYLHVEGWNMNERILHPIQLPAGFDPTWISLESTKSVNEWAALGLKDASGKPLPKSSLQASLIRPDGPDTGEAFLAYNNFKILMHWNKSQRFGITIATMAAHIAGRKNP